MKNVTFINAGAGSGKTHQLTTDLAQRLTTTNLQPSQVILTTFTELAAGEFKERARNEILKVEKVDEATKINCATQLDNAFIGTVHSISYRFIQKYWYLLEYGADIRAMSDQNQDFYLSQSISQIVTDEEFAVFRKMREVFNLKNNYGHPNDLFWLPDLKDIVEKMDYYDVAEVKGSIDESIDTVKKVFKGPALIGGLRNDLLTDFLGQYKEYNEAEIQKKINNGKDPNQSNLNRVALSEKYLTKGIKDFGEYLELVKFVEEAGGLKGFIKDITNFEDVLDSTNSSDFAPFIEEYIECIFTVAMRWRTHLDKYKKANHVISFNDMEKVFLAMLTDNKYVEVQNEIAETVKLLMVDEFQDSNPIQLKIFNRISELIAPNGGECVWVGDPKQAIYGFRGSDAEFVSKILKRFTFSADGKYHKEEFPDRFYLATDQLGKSWRSRPELVKFANGIFTDPFKKEGMLEKLIKLESNFEGSDTLKDQPALYRWQPDGDKITVDKAAQALAIKIKQTVSGEIQVHHGQLDKPCETIDYKDIAVLCRSNSDCDTVANALRKQGLPVSCEESSLMQCIEVHLVKTLLQYIQNPTNKLVRANLRILLEEQSTEDVLKDRIAYVIENDTQDDQWLDENDLLVNLKTLSNKYRALSVSDTVEALIDELHLRQLVAKWGDENRRIHNLSTVVNMAHSYDDMCLQMGLGSGIDGFLNFLATNDPEPSKDNSSNSIKVLTYHRAKGLEWPMVVLYSLWKSSIDDQVVAKKQFMGVNPCLCNNDDEDIFGQKYFLHFFPKIIEGNTDVPAGILTKIQNIDLFKELKEKAANEDKRLLYVGVTRAKDYLVTFMTNSSLSWLSNLGIGSGNNDNPWGLADGEVPEKLPLDIAGTPTSEMYIPQLNIVPTENNAKQLYLSPSRIDSFAKGYIAHQVMIDRGERGFKAGGVDNIVGSCIHDIFAVYNPDDQTKSVDMAKQIIAQYGVKLEGKENEIVESIGWLYGELTQKYGSPTRIEHELPIEYQLETGQYLRGEIDLLWFYEVDGKQKCVLIDYKSFPGSKDQTNEHTKKYYPQLSAYRAALNGAGYKVADALVYYPVIGTVMRLK